MQMTPLIAVHMTCALGAVLLGPVAIWARAARVQRPRLHRAFGKRCGTAARCSLLKNKHLFGAVFKRGIRSRETRSAAATYDYIVFAIPLLGQTRSIGT